MAAYNLPSLLVVTPLWGAFLLPFAGPLGRRLRNTLFLLFSSLTLLIALSLCGLVDGGKVAAVLGSFQFKGLSLSEVSFEVDGFDAIFVLMVSFLSFAGSLFSVWDTEDFSGRSRYMALFLLTTSGVLGMCVAADLFTFFVSLETSLIASVGLVAFWRDKPSSVEVAFKFLLSSQVAACCFLIAIGLLYGGYGEIGFSALAASVRSGMAETMALALILCSLLFFAGAFLLPAHAWFSEVSSPVPGGVNCLLLAFSQASCLVLVRILYLFAPPLGLERPVAWVVIAAGGLSVFLGALSALEEHRLKRLAGFIVVVQFGCALLAFGAGLWALGDLGAYWGFVCEEALRGGLLQVILCALAGGLLLLTSAAIYYAVGTRDMDRIEGLLRPVSFTGGALLFAALLLSGVPPFSGFEAKWKVAGAVFTLHPLLAALELCSTVLLMGVFVKILYSVLGGTLSSKRESVRRVPYGMSAGMALLAFLVLLFSAFPAWTRSFVQRAVRALLGGGELIEPGQVGAGGFGYWNSLMWLFFFALLGVLIEVLRFLTGRGRQVEEASPCLVGEGSLDAEGAGVPPSSFLNVTRLFPDSFHVFLRRFQSLDASDCVGYFVSFVAVVVVWLLLAV
ncbi:MAG: hypothetical protein GX256_10325 [Fretibacterium sp.]|nr:hypothetical protein [Fretibacterium sp.]